MITKISHLADIHVPKSITRHDEYRKVFKILYRKLRKDKPDRIVLVGDLVHDFLDLQGEQIILVKEFLYELTKIAPVRITRGNHDCFTPEHEVLTKNGWITLGEYVDNHNDADVLSFNSDNEIFEFQKPTENIKKKFSGNLKVVDAEKCNFTVTPTHEILLKYSSTGNYKKICAKDLSVSKELRIPLSSSENITKEDYWFELLGFCLADATFVIKNKKTMNGRIQFHFKKERKIEYLQNLLKKAKIPFTIRVGDKKRDTKVICIYSQPARDIMKFFNYSKELSYDVDLLNQDKYKIKSFINGYLNGDGCNVDYERYSCVNIFKINAEILTTLSNYIGYNAHIVLNSKTKGNYENSKKQYLFFINKSNVVKSTKINKINDINYDGNVYCLSVPNENLFIRNNGKTFITGNCRKKNLQRTDSIEAILNVIDNKKIIYYNETGFHDDENVTWAVWKHGEKDNSPWENNKDYVRRNEQTYIDLFHNPIGGCVSPLGYEFNSTNITKVSDFKGDFSMFGDIHLQQFFADKTKGYSSSLIEQSFAEGDGQFHGYLLWDINKGNVKEISVENDFTYNNVILNQFTDFDNLDLEVENEKPTMKVRIVWRTYPATRTKENERAIIAHLKDKYKNIIISNKNEFVVEDKIDINEEQIRDINDKAVQEDVFRNYLSEIGTADDIIEGVIDVDKEITSRLSTEELTSIEWDVIKFNAKNFMSYKEIEIDWRDMDGLYQITGLNTAGKTTIMKLISYLLYTKTLETEKRIKFGDSRYVNNNLSDDYCEGEIIIKANDEYFGIRKKTVISRKKDGEIKGASTAIKYYKLHTPDDEFTDDNNIDNLTEEDKTQTQKLINKTIGTYENYMRVVMTTSDTLNAVLSSDAADFIDALLYDSGLDIFDKKLLVFKDYAKEIFKERVSCNVEVTKDTINTMINLNIDHNKKIVDIETKQIPEVQKSINKGREFTESLIKKLHEIDDAIVNFSLSNADYEISTHKQSVSELNDKTNRLNDSINKLSATFDEERYNLLQTKKDTIKNDIYEIKMDNKNIDGLIDSEKYSISKINGEIQQLKNEGTKLKEAAVKLSKSKTCPTCGQLIKEDHRAHIDEEIKKLKKEMLGKADSINSKLKLLPSIEDIIENHKNNQKENVVKIENLSVESESLLKEIGILTNQKNDYEKRKLLILEKDNIPTQIENFILKIKNVEKNIEIYKKSLNEIEENKKTNEHIKLAKERLSTLENQKSELNDDVFEFKTLKSQNEVEIKNLEELIKKFEIQEKKELILNTYKKCTHRNGIPMQLLVTYAIPKINNELHKLLEEVGFSVWIDSSNNDIRLKLSYNTEGSEIDAISGSGKERTFASVCLKFALNQINAKSKPTIFLLDEVMSKLTEDSISEFVEILHLIKNKVKKLLMIEHNAEINPDYIIEVIKDDELNSHIIIR